MAVKQRFGYADYTPVPTYRGFDNDSLYGELSTLKKCAQYPYPTWISMTLTDPAPFLQYQTIRQQPSLWNTSVRMSLENVVLLPFARRTPVGLRSLPSILRTPSIHDDNTILFRLTISTRRRRSFIDNFAVPNMNRAVVHQCITYYWNSAVYLGQHVYKLICTFCVVIRRVHRMTSANAR